MTQNPCESFDDLAGNMLREARINPHTVTSPIPEPAQPPVIHAPAPPTMKAVATQKVQYLPLYDDTTLVTINLYDNGPPVAKTKRARTAKQLRRWGIKLQFFDLTEQFTPHFNSAALNATAGHTRSPDDFIAWLDDYEADPEHIGMVSAEQSTRMRAFAKAAKTIPTKSGFPVIGIPFTYHPGTTLWFDAICMLYDRHDEMRVVIAMPGGIISIDLQDTMEEGENKPKMRGNYDPNKLWVKKRK